MDEHKSKVSTGHTAMFSKKKKRINLMHFRFNYVMFIKFLHPESMLEGRRTVSTTTKMPFASLFGAYIPLRQRDFIINLYQINFSFKFQYELGLRYSVNP